MDNQVVLLVVAIVVIALSVLALRARNKRGAYIDTNSPQWQAAVQRAQQTIPLLKEIHSSSKEPVWVKYSIQTNRGDIEHPWGVLQHIDASVFRVTLETPLVSGKPISGPPFELPLSAIEDWQLLLPDGKVRGGFTTQAEIRIAREAGRPVPSHIAEMEGHFHDS